MRRTYLLMTLIMGGAIGLTAQPKAKVEDVIKAEKDFSALVAHDGIKAGFLAVSDPEAITFAGDIINIVHTYSSIKNIPGTLQWDPVIARMAAGGDLAFSSGPYTFTQYRHDTSISYGNYVSVWRADPKGELRLLIDMGTEHSGPGADTNRDLAEPLPPANGRRPQSAMPKIDDIKTVDQKLNRSLTRSASKAYRNIISDHSRYFVPGHAAIIGGRQVGNYLREKAVTIAANTIGSGQSVTNDLAYTYGRAHIVSGKISSDNFYLRIWERKPGGAGWRLLVESFSVK